MFIATGVESLSFIASVSARKAGIVPLATCPFSYCVPVKAAWHSSTTAILNTQ